ncbi:MAG: hypothetical protein FWF18_03855 [Dehalococcoidia bacterium]|nr:hypothetical protein [Dehalococcoidia bacterium]
MKSLDGEAVPAQVHPGGSAATEGSGGGEQSPTAPPDASSRANSFLQHGFMTMTILEGAQRPKDLAAGCQLLLPTSSRCFVTRKLVPPAWIYVQVHPGGSVTTEGSGGGE